MLKRFFLVAMFMFAPLFASDGGKKSNPFIDMFELYRARINALSSTVNNQQEEIKKLKSDALDSLVMNSYQQRQIDSLNEQLQKLTQKIEENRCHCHCNSNSLASNAPPKEPFEHPLVMLSGKEQDNHNNQ